MLVTVLNQQTAETRLTEKPVNYILRMLRTATVEVPCIRTRTQHFIPLYEPKIHERDPGGVIE